MLRVLLSMLWVLPGRQQTFVSLRNLCQWLFEKWKYLYLCEGNSLVFHLLWTLQLRTLCFRGCAKIYRSF